MACGGDTTWRRIHECCVHLHNCTQEWSALNSQAVNNATAFINTKLATSSSCQDLKAGTDVLDQESLAETLTKIMKKMESVVLRIGSLSKNLWSSAELLTSGEEPSLSSQLATYSRDIFNAYNEELLLHQTILDDLLTQTDRDTLTLYLSCWLHEPCLTDLIKDKMKTVLMIAENNTFIVL